jgi:thiol-disulfide isomerase/thioredoxin
MKKIITTTIILATILLSEAGFARNAPFIVSGEWHRGANVTEIYLYKIVYGRLERVSVALLQDDRSFVMAFSPQEEGFFVIGTGSPALRRDKYTFYFKPGDQLNFIVNDSSYTLVGENTRENIAMTAWHNFIQPLEQLSFYTTATFREFFPLLEERVQNPFTPTRTSNRTFDYLFAKYRKFDLVHCAITFSMRPISIPVGHPNPEELRRSLHPTNDDFPEFYRNLRVQDFGDNADILMFPYRLLPNILFIQNRFSDENLFGDNPNIALIERLLTNDTLKGEIFLTGILSGVRELPRMQEVNDRFAKYIVTQDQQRRFNQDIERINRLHLEQGIGTPGFDFTYKDVHGNDVSFSDFRGKIVYVDVWATWCGPCIAEIPHKKRIKEHFVGNPNIEFVSISTDRPRDIQKWKDFVAENGLTGFQLHGNVDSPMNISRLYNISGIPRFLLFDKQGNIVSTDAPRPSSPEIIPLLTRLLQQR